MNKLRLAGALGFLIGQAAMVYGAGSSRGQIRSQTQNQAEPHQVQVVQQPQMINLSLIDALVAIHEEGLAGIFGYIAESNAAPAFAEYLFRTPKALKLFVQKGERDLKETGGISEWDKEVYLYVIGINSNGTNAGAELLPAKLLDRVATLSLATGLPLSEITMRRKH